MRNQGQQFETLGKFETWIDENLNELYADEALQRIFGKDKKDKKERDVKVLFAEQTLQAKKEKFKERMIAWAEKTVLRRRHGVYEKKVNEVIARTHYKLLYQEKAAYVESAISQNIKYFRLHGAGSDRLFVDLLSLNKLLRKNEAKLNKKTQYMR